MSLAFRIGLISLGVALGACNRDPPRIKVAPEVLARIGTKCDPAQGCGDGLTCAAGSNFAHTYAGSTCELACDADKQWTCPKGWRCGLSIDGPGSSLPGLCFDGSRW